MREVREELSTAEPCVLPSALYERAYIYYCRRMIAKICFILAIAIVGLVGIINSAIEPSMISRLMAAVSYVLLFGQVLTLPDGVIVDRQGNRFDLNSGRFIPKSDR